MKAKADMNCVGKTFCAFVLLTVAVAMVPMGSQARNSTGSDIEPSQENNSSAENISESKIVAGSSVSLTCGDISRADLVVVTWKIRPRTGNHCALAYRTDQNKTDRTNCSERMDWKSSPETDSALQIRQVTLTDEGCYICEAVTSGGNLHRTYTLTVLVPPEVTLTCDSNGTAVCKAAAGKPAAQISWDPNGDPRTELENHTDGIVTVLSIYSPRETSITCLVSHPAWNTSQSKECPSDNGNMFLRHFSICAGLLGIFFILVFVFFCKLHCGRVCYKSKIPETAPPHNMQDSNEQQELEPYASYLQKENVIYNTVYEVTVSEDLPPGLQSAT
ncbi:LOW QUALITY PROTEIN: cell surface glycoprotein CD200 receptor 1 [Gopherus flavomarginatus]|uniref:LOW QUALITY PROTEIN: cell surface glycoprotein CD200 receptor 1 n=1 Tax=Gopherus flavomarginatus TaxID=286002 RepID=UPI0021CC223D|nr:LOW QUALITY PROTEIN: cell surface glycoprotein CD200 receptor 1 [Gopherus flavomarginatus]